MRRGLALLARSSSGGGALLVGSGAPRRGSRWMPAAMVATGTGVLACAGAALAVSAGEQQLLDISDDGLPMTYDVEKIDAFWHANPRVVLWRFAQVTGCLLPFAAGVWADRKLGRLDTEEEKRARAVTLRELLTELGPAFIKLGQGLSTRPDLLPEAALLELQKLCDAVPSFPTRKAREIVRAELGEAGLDAFADFSDDTAPVASASLGQVYRLALKEGGEVAVKIQRPDMKRSVSLDIFLMRYYARFVESTKKALMWSGVMAVRKQFDVQLLDNVLHGAYLELDYLNEGRNQDAFRRDLVPLVGAHLLRVPIVHWPLSSHKVLVSEWVNGEQLVKASPETIARLVPLGVECFLAQLLQLGRMHADPHAGNLLVDEQGRLVLIDFGLCVEVPAQDAKTMTGTLLHLMDGDVPALVEDAVQLGFLPADDSFDKPALVATLRRIFSESKLAQAALAGGASGSPEAYGSVKSRRRHFKDVSTELNEVFFVYPFAVPQYFALTTRSLIMLEGIALVGNEDFDIFAATYPYALRKSVHVFDAEDMVKLSSKAAANTTAGLLHYVRSEASSAFSRARITLFG